MTQSGKFIGVIFALVSALLVVPVHAQFSSGSTGSDGPLAPTTSTVLQIPTNGIFNFTTINIPAGVTVTFTKNASNTPVTLLATGDVTIAGTIDVSGQTAINTGPGLFGDRSLPGSSGPGGFDGGRGGMPEVNRRAGNGLGPGAGGGGDFVSGLTNGGGGAGFGLAGVSNVYNISLAGTTYGSNSLVPLIGGSGGGGGVGAAAADGYVGSGGGGGGGAILIAASGTVNITGAILAKGGNGGNFVNSAANSLLSATGGGGSGGAIRLVAPSIVGGGALTVTGGLTGTHSVTGALVGGAGGKGRTSSEIATSGTLTLTGLPSLAIASVGGVSAPPVPTGVGDIALAANAPNPITVTFTTTGVPTGGTIKLTMTPARGVATSATSTAITGNMTTGTASASIDIPLGASTLFASTSYTLVIAMGEALSKFAKGERVESILLTAATGESSKAMLVTVSGKQYPASEEALRLAAIGS